MKNTKKSSLSGFAVSSVGLVTLGMWGLLSPSLAQVGVEAGALMRNSADTTSTQKTARTGTKAASGASHLARSGQNITGPSCTGDIGSPGRLLLPLGKSTLMRLPEPIRNRTIGNPAIVQAMLVSPESLYLLGQEVGTTNMIIQGKSGACTVVDVVVDMDSSGLETTLRSLMPEEKDIKVTAAAESLVLSGTVADSLAVSRAVEIANAFVRKPSTAVQGGTPRSIAAQEGNGTNQAERQQPTMAQAGGGKGNDAGLRIVNLLSVRAPQQVMLEVKVAEVSKTLLDKLGFSNVLQRSSGSWTYTLLSNFITGTANGVFDATKSNGNSLTLEAEKRDGLIRILAEPTLMAISGQEGRFLAGGTIFIPVEQRRDGGITLEEKDFGVKLTFTPTVLSEGRINLKVHPEVSELSREGVGITAVGVPGRAILPLITKRNAATTVQLNDGQSFAIGGLIKSNSTANIKALPILGEVPVLGALFRSTDFQEDKSELLFVVTPRLVKPIPANYTLPTDNVHPPGRAELFLGGKLEGRPPQESNPPAAPVEGTQPAAPPSSQPSVPPASSESGVSTSGFELK